MLKLLLGELGIAGLLCPLLATHIQFKRDVKIWGGSIKMVRDTEHRSDKENLRELYFFCLAKERLQ